jgi:hypothetical protein
MSEAGSGFERKYSCSATAFPRMHRKVRHALLDCQGGLAVQGAGRTGGRASRTFDSSFGGPPVGRVESWTAEPSEAPSRLGAVAHFFLDGFGQFFDLVGFFDDGDGELVFGGFGYFVVEFLGEIEEMRGV